MPASPRSYLPHVLVQGVKQLVYPSIVVVVVIVGMKIARSRILGICVCCKHNQSIDIGEKLVCTCFELFKKAYMYMYLRYKSYIFCLACLWFIDHTHSIGMC